MFWLAEYISPARITFMGALINAIAGLLISRDQPKAKGFLLFLICLGTLVAASGALWTLYEDDRSSHVLLEKTETIADLSKKLMVKSDEISELNKRLAEKSDELFSMISGGDSYGFIVLSVGTDRPFLTFFSKGPYPLYDVLVTIRDPLKIREIFKSLRGEDLSLYPNVTADESEMARKAERQYRVGNVTANAASSLGRWQLPTDTIKYTYYVSISARNGFFRQELKIHRIGDGWAQARRVYRSTGFHKKGILLNQTT